jgi:hypothetical protein
MDKSNPLMFNWTQERKERKKYLYYPQLFDYPFQIKLKIIECAPFHCASDIIIKWLHVSAIFRTILSRSLYCCCYYSTATGIAC